MRTQFDLRSLAVILILAGGVGCFHGADVSKIRCNDSKYCPKDYVCVVPANSQEGRCSPSGSGGAGGGKIDGAVVLDGPASKGGAGGIGMDSGNGGAGGMGGDGDIDAIASGGAGGDGADAPMATGGTSTGGATGSDVLPMDATADVFTPDAPGTCSTDKDCPTQKPLCLGNQCAKCASDNDCVGRSGPACAASGLCVGCTANSHCKGAAATCDTATNQCVGCTKRSDCSGACQTCSAGVCVAVKGQDDPTVCAGTCDATGACKSKQGQTCKSSSDCVNGLPCADGYCCNKACSGSCEACDVGASAGTCTTLAANTTPRSGRTACVATDATCAGRCDGSSAACAYPSNTPCGTSSCVGNSYQAAGTCSNGACNTPPVQTCSNGCVPGAGGCVACAPGTYQCSGSQPQKCDSMGAWQNYGSRSCTGSCETCTASAATATCTNVTTPPSGKSCNGTDATCKGYCSGSSAACTYPNGSIPCSSSTCTAGSTTTQYCDGAGACSTVKNQSCNGFPCASASSCAVTCSALSTTGCLDGYKCGIGGNTCTPATVPCGPNGSTLCSIANKGVCIYNAVTGLTTCATSATSDLSIPCNSKAECPTGSSCCMTGYGPCTNGWNGFCHADGGTGACVDGPFNGFVYVLCDPAFGSADCPSGQTCTGNACFPGLFYCSSL